MAEELDLEILEGYQKKLAAPMAAMFNSWDELWPGSFTQGVPYTPERVDCDYGSQRAITLLIAWDKKTKKAVGFCSLLQHWRDSEAAYIGTLGVSPHVLGKKVGKRLLLRSMEIAMQKGFQRLDLYTWAGNLRAVPLYKKIGLMWDPEEEGVHMRGYIPAILQHPLCAPFFSAHDAPHGWYEIQQRELTQAPDDFQHKGMKIYPYSFEFDSNELHVTVDRYASAISAIDAKVDGNRLKVATRLKDHLVFCGIPSEYILEIENGTNEAVSISVQLEGFSGLHFDGSTTHSVELQPNQSKIITVPFFLDSNAPLFRKDFKSPVITTNLVVNGKQSQLQTGMKIQPTAEIQTQFGPCRLVPEGKVAFPLTIRNNTSIPLEGIIRFQLPDAPLAITSSQEKLKIKSKGFTGVTMEITASSNLNPGTYDIWASLHLHTTKGKEHTVTTRKFRIPVFNIPDGFVAIGEDDQQRHVVAIAKDYQVQLAREGGSVTITYPLGLGSSVFLRREIGPPFGLSPFRYAEQEVRIEQGESSTVVSLSATHFERPLLIDTRVTFNQFSPVVSQEIWVTNQGSESHTFQLRLMGPGGISLQGGKSFIPLQSGIIEDRLTSLLTTYPAIPGNPEAFKETWIAAEFHSYASGQVWHPENVDEIHVALGRLTRLSYCSITLAPQEKRCLSRVWFVTKAADWKAIRRTWREKITHQLPSESEEAVPLQVSPIMHIVPTPLIIPHPRTIHQKYQFRCTTAFPQSGEFHIDPPPGWNATISHPNGKNTSSSLSLENISASNTPPLHLTLEPSQEIPDEFAIYTGHAIWKIPVEEHQTFPIVQLGSSKDSVQITEKPDKDLPSYKVSNGRLEFKVSPKFGGTLYSLKNSAGTEFLASAFPNPTPKVFLQNYHGGLQFIVSSMDGEPFQAVTYQEKMRVNTCQVGDTWQGVEVRWKGKVQDCCRGVDFRMQYLTTPGNPLILSNWKIRNSTTAPLQLLLLQVLDPAFNGELTGAELYTEWGGTPTTIKGSPIPAAFKPDVNITWLRRDISDKKSAMGLALLSASKQPNLFVFVTHEFCFLITLDILYLRPKEERTIRSALFVDPPNQTHLRTLQPLLNDIV